MIVGLPRMHKEPGGHPSGSRRFPLGDEVGDDAVKASAADGVLEITLPAPKSELETNAKEIPIATGSSN